MNRWTRLAGAACVLACCALIGAEPARLPADQMAKAIRNDSISIPTPGELFAALEKPGKTELVRTISRADSHDLSEIGRRSRSTSAV